MRRSAASIWTAIAVGSVLNAAEPTRPAAPEGSARSGTPTGFVDLTAAPSAETDGAARPFTESVYDPQQRSDARGPTWLLDAMNRHTDAEAATLDDLIREARERPNRAGQSRNIDEREAAAPRANPFAGFMASWMTPKDYALLQVEIAPASGDSARHEHDRRVSNGLLRNRRAEAQNPYLAAQQPSREQTPEKPLVAPPSLAPSSPATPASPPLLPTPVRATTPVPDPPDRSGWQPASSEDKKYYPQLNRF